VLCDTKALYNGSSLKQLSMLSSYIDHHHPKLRFSASQIGSDSSNPQILEI